jgi:hypothetical protein
LSSARTDSPRARIDHELDHGIELQVFPGEQPLQRLGLRDRARKAVEDEPLLGVWLIDAVGDDLHHDLVGHELAARHQVLCLEAHRRAGRDRRAQHVAGRKLHDAVARNKALRLCAFAGPGRSKQYQPHRVRPRSFDFLIRPSY